MKPRLASLDALRGAIMIIMALDHVRDFTHWAVLQFRPDDLSRTYTLLFVTRWITHFCAPVFAFAAGLGAYLWMQRGRTPAQLSRYLLTRGLMLVALDLTVIQLALFVLTPPRTIILTVLWVLGLSMIVLAGLLWLPRKLLLALSIGVIAGHNLLDMNPVLANLHQVLVFPLAGWTVVLGYPLVPWFAVMATGFCSAPLLDRRRRLYWGLGLTAGFFLLRGLNLYGDPVRWTQTTLPLSFLNCAKYPPSLAFLLMTLGPALLFWTWLEGRTLSDRNPLLVFGRTPLFYFVVHLFVGEALWLTGHAYSLWAVYLWWALVVALMYPVCRWYAGRRSSAHE